MKKIGVVGVESWNDDYNTWKKEDVESQST
jgi:hypothetical protein